MAGRLTSPHGGPYLIAEIGVNHDGARERASEMVRAAAAAGFDAVKFQYWVPEELLAPCAPNASYQGEGDQRDLLAPLLLPVPDLEELRTECRELGVAFGVTPDGLLALEQTSSLDADFVKIGSGDADNPWLTEAAARQPRPVVISTGMATDEEVVAMAGRFVAHDDVTFLHCVSSYPTALDSAGLDRMAALRVLTGRPCGWSDHTIGAAAAVASVALGATIIEKHVTYDPAARGPDHAMSLPLSDAPAWVTTIRAAAAGLVSGRPRPDEAANRLLVRKALYPVRELAPGHVLRAGDVVPLRPLLDGLPAGSRDVVLGRRLARAVSPGAPLRPGDLE